MTEIMLANGRGVTLIDDDDYELVSKYSWSLSSSGYAISTFRKDGKQWTQPLHRLILNAPDGVFVDHKNNNRVDNRKSNLRLCSALENAMNAVKRKDGKSQYKGVYRSIKNGYYVAHIQHKGSREFLGYYKEEMDAAFYYNLKAKELFGEFAYLNTLPEGYVPREQFKPTKARGKYSQYRGVTFDKREGKFIAQIQYNKKRKRIGSFLTERTAAEMYNVFALELHGENAILNEFEINEGVITT